jgi:hypothetical protein
MAKWAIGENRGVKPSNNTVYPGRNATDPPPRLPGGVNCGGQIAPNCLRFSRPAACHVAGAIWFIRNLVVLKLTRRPR